MVQALYLNAEHGVELDPLRLPSWERRAEMLVAGGRDDQIRLSFQDTPRDQLYCLACRSLEEVRLRSVYWAWCLLWWVIVQSSMSIGDDRVVLYCDCLRTCSSEDNLICCDALGLLCAEEGMIDLHRLMRKI